MTTVSDLIQLALKDLNVLAPGEALSSEDAADALATLNMMLGQWQVQKLYVVGQRLVTFACTGAQTYAIGPSAAVDTVLPASVDSAQYTLNGITYPVSVLNSREDYENITLKSIAGTLPTAIFFQRDYPLGTIYVWPQPSVGSITLVTKDVLTEYASLSDDTAVPPEYALAMRFSLAELLMPTFGVGPRPDIVANAIKARKVMKRNNLSIPLMGQPQEVLNNGRFSIYSGQ
jgi:hypothetical protein